VVVGRRFDPELVVEDDVPCARARCGTDATSKPAPQTNAIHRRLFMVSLISTWETKRVVISLSASAHLIHQQIRIFTIITAVAAIATGK
jgi:hypothetical protein